MLVVAIEKHFVLTERFNGNPCLAISRLAKVIKTMLISTS
jgi:hypothetical protein